MKAILYFLYLVVLLGLGGYGYVSFRNEWRTKIIIDQGEIVEVRITHLNCPLGEMTFVFEDGNYTQKISSRDCALFNQDQKIKLKYNRDYPDQFAFVNEHRPNVLILSALEMVLALIGLIANGPFYKIRKSDP
ncbi:MAG: hypothetical protein JSS79_05905 [Bacteroidetes bacterium]|nr:hypothetical protein [Bacteroidota bacterium]